MSYPPSGGYPGYGPPASAPYGPPSSGPAPYGPPSSGPAPYGPPPSGPAPYGPPSSGPAPYGPPPSGPAPYRPPPSGPSLGFDNLTINPSPAGPPGSVPGYPPAGGMPMPGQGPSTYAPPTMAPYMSSAVPQPGPMPTPHTVGAPPMNYPYSQTQPVPGGQPMSFGAAAMATTAFPGYHRSQAAGPAMPMPNDHRTVPSTQLYGNMPSAQHHGPMPVPRPTVHSAPSAPKAAAQKSPSRQKQRGRPSVTEHSPFDPEKDADVLRKAMKGLGCDSKAIIYLLCSRTNAQRKKIERSYKTMHGRDLIDDLKSELGGHFEDVVVALMTSADEYDASLLRKAIKGLGTDEGILIEIICSRSNAEIASIKQAYRTLYDRDVERDVAGDTSGHFKKFLISLLQANREESDYVDHARAQADAQALYKAGEKRLGTDESKFNSILVSRSFHHLRATFDEYAKICKHDIQDSIKREMSGDLRDGMITVVQIIRDTPAFFSEKLYKSMKGLGTDDKTLIRIVVTRSEVDLLDIKDKFQATYHTTLAKYIADDTKGNYKKILLGLLGNR